MPDNDPRYDMDEWLRQHEAGENPPAMVYTLDEIAERFTRMAARKGVIPGIWKVGDEYRVVATIFDNWYETEDMAMREGE